MKRVASFSALIGAVLFNNYGFGQSASLPEPILGSNSLLQPFIFAPPSTPPGQWTSPFSFGPNSFAHTNLLYSAPRPQPILPPRVLLFDSPSTASNSLPPGIYKTEPYTCLVLVPGPHPDDKCIIGNGAGQPNIQMPIRRPELQFIPRKPSQ
jgi:hypothetical protein